MPCKRCVSRQRKLVDMLCRKPDGKWCKRAKARLERMLKSQEKK
jgi:hypothetical protein